MIDPPTSRRLAKRLHEKRTALGLSQAELALRSHLEEDFLRAVESGERHITIGALSLLAVGFGCTVEELLGDEAGAEMERLVLGLLRKAAAYREAETPPVRDPAAKDP